MRKFYVFLMAAAFGVHQATAQTILSEDFETESTESVSLPVAASAGWTTVNSYSGSTASFNWHNYYAENGTISGKHVAGCDGPTYQSDPKGGFGPREEILLTPELNLDNTYELSFTFRVSPMNCQDASLYDLQVRVVEDGNLSGAETVFSIQNQAMMRDAGVMVFPITTWDPYVAKVDLSDWQGQTVKLAFVYKMQAQIANVVWLDDVVVKQVTQETSPRGVLSIDSYNVGKLYVGEKMYTEIITMTNQGKNGLQITGIDMPEGVGINIDPATVNLDKYENVQFQFSYKASLTSPATANIVIHTNGGDIPFTLTATKEMVPDGYILETFEEYFPPAGWKNNGWGGTSIALEGDRSAYASGSYTDDYITSPRLDLLEGGQLIFTYYNQFDSETGEYYQENDISVEVSYDGGNTWTQKWIFDYTQMAYGETVTVDLGIGSDNSYVRWKNSKIEYDDEGGSEFSTFYLDRVLLPHVWGADGTPKAATLVSPKLGATDVYPRDIVLEWGPAQFATGYKLYVGSDAAATNLVNGLNVKNVLTYTLPVADYETTYRWKVVPYNEMGDAASSEITTWIFTTQPDASVTEYPFEENFAGNSLPNGWMTVPAPTYSRKWYVNTYYPYVSETATSNALTSGYLGADGEQNSVTTQNFKIPEGSQMQISFVWGDEHPSDLVVDPSGMAQKNNVEPNNGVSEGVFQIFDGEQWIDVTTISENSFDGDHKYWIEENIDLTAYAGKTIQFRWIHKCYNWSRDGGTSIAHVVVEERATSKARFNKTEWAAGKVNYGKAVNSGEKFTLLNKGIDPLTVKSATFSKSNFSTSLATGTTIAPGEGTAFSMQFDALETADVVNDQLTVEFEDGYTVSLPVSGEALAEDVLYYAFEPNDLDYPWTDFTTIDVDNAVSYDFVSYWLHFEKSGQKFAFWPAWDDMDQGLYGIMAPPSGEWALLAASPNDASGASADNWIVSKQLTATTDSKFSFYARNWECLQSVLPDPQHRVSVLVSETSNTNTNTFTVLLPEEEIPFLDGKEWKYYEVDLSAYAGKDIYVALRHTTNGTSNVAFFDDFMFSHFGDSSTGIQEIDGDIDTNAEVTVYNMSGMLVANGRGRSAMEQLGKGLYIIQVKSGDQVQTYRAVRK